MWEEQPTVKQKQQNKTQQHTLMQQIAHTQQELFIKQILSPKTCPTDLVDRMVTPTPQVAGRRQQQHVGVTFVVVVLLDTLMPRTPVI